MTFGKRRNKYNAKKTLGCLVCALEQNGFSKCNCGKYHLFDSNAEFRRFQQLRLMEKAGQISNLTIQKRYELHAFNPTSIPGQKIGDYIADFSYNEKPEFGRLWKLVVEDVKSVATMTALAKWKLKHMKAQYGIEVKIV